MGFGVNKRGGSGHDGYIGCLFTSRRTKPVRLRTNFTAGISHGIIISYVALSVIFVSVSGYIKTVLALVATGLLLVLSISRSSSLVCLCECMYVTVCVCVLVRFE